MSDWQSHALCAEVDPELWFPAAGESNEAAKRICGRCPVRPQCLSYALANHEWHGVWGGLSYHERLKLEVPQAGRRLESARAHARLLTALPVPEAARELGVSERTVHRWRVALLQEAS